MCPFNLWFYFCNSLNSTSCLNCSFEAYLRLALLTRRANYAWVSVHSVGRSANKFCMNSCLLCTCLSKTGAAALWKFAIRLWPWVLYWEHWTAPASAFLNLKVDWDVYWWRFPSKDEARKRWVPYSIWGSEWVKGYLLFECIFVVNEIDVVDHGLVIDGGETRDDLHE